MLHRFWLCCCLVFMLFAGVNAYAGGYQVALQGNKQTGMAHTGVCLYQGASSMFFNPGLLSAQENRFSFSAHVNAVDGRLVYFNPTTGNTYRNVPQIGTPVSFYGAAKFKNGLAVGLGFNTPYGSSLEYEEGWSGRFLVTDISLRALYLQPTVSYQIGPVGFGVGLLLGSGSLELNRDLPIQDSRNNSGSLSLRGNETAVGYNLGIYIELAEFLHFGASYRSAHTYEVRDGEADFNVPPTARDQLPDQQFSAGLSVPAIANVGLSGRVGERIWISGEINFNYWSTYENLEINFSEETEILQDISEPRNWRDTQTFRFGVQYQQSEKLTLRMGYSQDNTPVDIRFYSPETPDSDRNSFHLGLSFKPVQRLSVDASFVWVEGQQVEAVYEPSNFGGAYKSRAFVYGIGLEYSL